MSPRLCSTRARFTERVLPRGSPGLDAASSPPCPVPTQHVPVAPHLHPVHTVLPGDAALLRPSRSPLCSLLSSE